MLKKTLLFVSLGGGLLINAQAILTRPMQQPKQAGK